MWERGVLSEAYENSPTHSERPKCRRAVTLKLTLCHSISHTVTSRFIRDNRNVVCALHQRQLSWRLEHPATGGYRSGINELQRWSCESNSIIKEEANSFLYAYCASANATILQDFRNPLIRTLVFFPGSYVFANFYQLARSLLFELWTDPGNFTSRWYH